MKAMLLRCNMEVEKILKYFGYDVITYDYQCIYEPSPDLIFFDGGDDVSPSLYGEENIASNNNEYRDGFEKFIFDTYKNLPTRFVGICRGSQFLNVMFGGNLWQDLPKYHPMYHTVEVTENNLPFLPRKFTVNSTHHQGVKKLADCLFPVLIEPSTGVIEGYRDKDDIKVRAVQSHPEYFDPKYNQSKEVLNWLFGG